MENLNTRSALKLAQFRQILSTSNISLLVSIFLALILVYVQRDLISKTVIISWLSLVFIISAFRALLVFSYIRQPVEDAKTIRKRMVKFRIMVALNGLAWGSAGFLLFPADAPQHQMFLMIMLAGLSLGGVISFSSDLISVNIYALTTLLPVNIHTLFTEGTLYQAMSYAGWLYIAFLLTFIRFLNRSLSENIIMRIEAIENSAQVKLSEERYRLLLNHSPVGIFHFDHNLVITYCNTTIVNTLNTSFHITEGLDMKLFMDPAILPASQKAISGSMGRYEGPYKSRFSNKDLWITMICAPSFDSKGNVAGGIGIVQDITAQKMAADEINNLAFYDPLTQLPNRRYALDRLKQAIGASSRSGRAGALLFIDLDNFKNINDTLGHETGDFILQEVGKRIEACVREIDTVAHLSGDEFVVILEYLSDQIIDAAKQAETIGEKIRQALIEPYVIGHHAHHSTPSIGITLFNDSKFAVDDLMKQADIAMYQAKKYGRNQLRFFDPKMQIEIDTQVSLETELHKAIELQEFKLYYQIQVDSMYRPLGAEVLIRWEHPIHGLIPPSVFIPLAEDTSLILPIGQWVLEKACDQIYQWQRNIYTRNLVLSVNISASQFRQTDFVSNVQKAINRNTINPRLLKLELTESLLLEDIDVVINTMANLQEIGIQFSLDDFGTGYSSLQYLKKLPLNQLKIDQSFVRDLVTDNNDRAIVTTIIAMAHSMSLEVIAEGVETEEQRTILLNNKCTQFQGYLFGKPMPLAQFENILQQMSGEYTSPIPNR